MRPAPLALLAAIVPTVAILLAFYVSALAGAIPMCNPFIDGCASISATGRQSPGALIFRAVQLPYAALLALLWVLSAAWLRELGATTARSQRWIVFFGFAGALALIVYVTFLGTTTPIYAFMRRFGIYFYFLGTVIAQLIVAVRLLSAEDAWRMRTIGWFMLGCALFPFALGVLNLFLKTILADADAPENAIEWIASLSMQAWFVGLYVAWRRSGFTTTAGVIPPR